MRVAVINTGGTISCVGDPLKPMTAIQFAQACNELVDPVLIRRFPKVEISYLLDVTFPGSNNGTLDSANLQPTDWCIMAKGVLDHYQDFDGFVLLHGTDSMGFTGGALPFLLNSFDTNGCGTALLDKPVIITGSQVPIFSQNNDGFALHANSDAMHNLCGAIASACSGIAEVGIYFYQSLYRGSRALKTNSREFDAFSSPSYPALAEYGKELRVCEEQCLPAPTNERIRLSNEQVLLNQWKSVDYIQNNIDQFPVVPLKAFPASFSMSPAHSVLANLIDAAVQSGAKGIILEAYGAGNFPSGNPDSPESGAVYQSVLNATKAGISIVSCSQVVASSVDSSVYAAGAWLSQVGALAPADMTPLTALAKLMILMTVGKANGWSREQVQSLVQTNLTGEMTIENSLDSLSSD